MKSIRSVINKGYSEIGIRPTDTPTRNGQLFEEARQVRLTKAGLEGYIPDVNDILDPSRSFYDSVTDAAITITRRWPFPQVFLTDAGLYVGALEGLYKVVDPYPDRYPDIILYDFSSGATVWPWVCIPIPGYPAFTSGTRLVYYDSNALSYLVVS